MSWEREILDTTVEDLVSRNSHRLLAAQLQGECQRYLDTVERFEAELQRIRTTLSSAESIGVRVLTAKHQGRKTVKLDDLIED